MVSGVEGEIQLFHLRVFITHQIIIKITIESKMIKAYLSLCALSIAVHFRGNFLFKFL